MRALDEASRGPSRVPWGLKHGAIALLADDLLIMSYFVGHFCLYIKRTRDSCEHRLLRNIPSKNIIHLSTPTVTKYNVCYAENHLTKQKRWARD